MSPEPTEQILQQLTRLRTAAGAGAIRGTIKAHFTPGERTATLYVGFCPPFARLPELDTELDDADLAATVTVIQLLHNGAQLEVRLNRPAEAATQISISFFASESSVETPAEEA